MLWLILAGWLLLALLFALLVGSALTKCQQEEDRMFDNALRRADSESHSASGGGEPSTRHLLNRNRQRATCHRTRLRT